MSVLNGHDCVYQIVEIVSEGEKVAIVWSQSMCLQSECLGSLV
jgi:hypothetical protein